MTQILFSGFKAPSQVWETDVEAGEGGRWGKGGEVDCVSGSSERHRAAPFSHYPVVSVCLRVFYTEELDADIIPRPEICPCLCGGMAD